MRIVKPLYLSLFFLCLYYVLILNLQLLKHLVLKSCRKALSLFLAFASALTVKAQAQDTDTSLISFTYKAETRASFAGGVNTPFWLVSNIHGLGSPEFNNGYVRGEIFKPMDEDKKFSWGAGVDLAAAWNLPAVFSTRQLYGELHYRALWISLGSRNFTSEYNDTRLSSGDLLFSNNAMAIPQLRIGTKGFEPFWGTKEWLSVKAYVSYGAFTDAKWQKNWVKPGGDRNSGTLFCARGLWLRGGNLEKFPLTLDIGVEMGTQFGGTIYKDGAKFKMPSGPMAFLKAFIPLSGDSSTPEGEQINVEGNMTGEYVASITYIPAPGWKIRPYWEHYFEDHSQIFLEYGLWKDGLWGIELTFPKNRFVTKLVYEHVATKDQSGAVLNNYSPEIPEQVSGRDGYFTHYLYGAWQNWGMTIGTPLAISPLYNKNHELYIYNTRFFADHIGLEGQPLDSLKWRFLITFTRNWGTYYRPLSDVMNNCSGLFELNYNPAKLKGFYANAALAWDKGKLLGNNFGGMISIGYEGSFHF